MAMTITLSPELQKRIAEKVERDDIRSADALVEQALTFYLEFEEGGMDEEESFETKDPFSQSHSGSPHARPTMAERAGGCHSVFTVHAGPLPCLAPILKTLRHGELNRFAVAGRPAPCQMPT